MRLVCLKPIIWALSCAAGMGRNWGCLREEATLNGCPQEEEGSRKPQEMIPASPSIHSILNALYWQGLPRSLLLSEK